MAISGGYRVHEDVQKRYRVPDLLTREEFKAYMASVYNETVEFRDLTEEETEAINSGQQILSVPPRPLDSDVELARLRKALGIEDIEAKLNIKRETQTEKRDPIVELDSKILSPEEFEEKYGKPNIPKQESKSTDTSTRTTSKK